MVSNESEAFFADFAQELQVRAQGAELFLEDAFLEQVTEVMQDAGEILTFDQTRFDNGRGVRIDGYGGDPRDSDGVLSLIVSDFDQSGKLRTLTHTDMNKLFNRATSFLRRSMDEGFRASLDETDAAFGLADLICTRWNEISRVRVFIVTNKVLSRSIDSVDADAYDNRKITYNVWDLSRLQQFLEQGHEEIEVDFELEFGGSVPAIHVNADGSDYEAYLFVIRGDVLADVYERWGTRLLEQNVRVFLQARGSVNKGIRNTLENAPEMFLAYNNGLAATATSVDVRTESGLTLIDAVRDLQIVNGGQTTASIHAASRRKDVDLSKVQVQVKLSKVSPDRMLDVVPKISEYANSQNRVNAADFFSNHPFHVAMERFSRRLMAPSQDGTLRQSKWFYERARGQYAEARSGLSASEQKRFDTEFPRDQQFNKTDLAKYENVWNELPHVVSRGAQKNFAEYAGRIGTLWDKDQDQFGERYFQEIVAKAIVFRNTERLVQKQEWYGGGYRANIVAYALSRMASEARRRKSAVDFEDIWKNQAVPAAMQLAIVVAAETANRILTDPPQGQRNVSEWAKQQACWAAVEKTPVDWPDMWLDSLISSEERSSRKKQGKRNQRELKGIEAQIAVVKAGTAFWTEVAEWGASRQHLNEKDVGILKVASMPSSQPPSEQQSLYLVDLARRLAAEGCVACTDFPDA